MVEFTPKFAAHLARKYQIRFFPRVDETINVKAAANLVEPMTQHSQVGIMPLGSHSYSMSYSGGIDRIGRFCSIGINFRNLGDRHPVDWVSTSPVFYRAARLSRVMKSPLPDLPDFESAQDPVYVGNDVWIGDNVTIAGGVTVGDGAILAYGAIVTKDVPPYAVVGGTPAKLIKYRFEKELRDRLLASQWWNYPVEELAQLPHNDPQSFIDQFDKRSKDWAPVPENRINVKKILRGFLKK